MKIKHIYAYHEYVDVNDLVKEVQRKLETWLSERPYNCNNISFIYRITPQMCIDCLEEQQHKYDSIFEDIEATYYGMKIITVNYIAQCVKATFHEQRLLIKPSCLDTFILEED